MRKVIATLWLAAALLLCGLPALAQGGRELVETLMSIQRAMNEVRADIADVETQMAEAPNRARREAIGQELTELRAKLARQRQNFETIASGLNLQAATDNSEEKLDWQAELKELISPLLKELKQITDRPREIDRLRTEIASHQSRLQGADKAMARIGEVSANAVDPELRTALGDLELKWREHKEQLLSDIAVARYQLEQKLSEEQSFAASARNIFESFFKSRGKNLLVAMGAFFLVFFALRFLHGFIHRRTPMQRMEQESFLLRLFDVLSYMGIVLAASTASLVVLYLSGDWVLLGLTFILLLAVVWSAKEGLRRFWEQGKLILNIGGVRVGERIIWNGLPWRVETLHYYSTLVNPAFSGGRIRVQLNDLIDQVSRPLGNEEDWFPSREGDWVMLADGSYGQVQRQTPEHVRLQLIGGSHKTFQIADYLGQTPRNLSQGFTVGTTFGVDYKHQAIATHEIPETFRAAVEEGIRQAGLGDMLESVSADFKAAGASSLDIGLWTTMKEGAGHKFYAIERLMQRICTETCTARGWEIPFAQITVHQAK
jgi:hypothetical protein